MAANELVNSQTWKLAAAAKASGGMLVKAFSQVGATEAHVDALQRVGLVQKEHVIICKRTSGLVNRVPSIDILRQLDEKGVRCGSCGRRLAEERVDELIAPTDLARDLLDHSRWMAVLLMEELQAAGVGPQNVLLEFREASEEVDAFIDIDGSLVMVELKDKEFSMGHAYALSARIAMYHPKYVVIASSEKVAPEVKTFFDRTKPEARLSFIENLGGLAGEIENLANLARSSKVQTLLEYFNPLTLGVDIPKLVASKLGIALPTKESIPRLTLPNFSQYATWFGNDV